MKKINEAHVTLKARAKLIAGIAAGGGGATFLPRTPGQQTVFAQTQQRAQQQQQQHQANQANQAAVQARQQQQAKGGSNPNLFPESLKQKLAMDINHD